MAKRPAEYSLEETSGIDSPASKRSRRNSAHASSETNGHESRSFVTGRRKQNRADHTANDEDEAVQHEGADADADLMEVEMEMDVDVDVVAEPNNTTSKEPECRETESARPDAPAGQDEADQDDGEDLVHRVSRQVAPTAGFDDLYLDSINRRILDFDFEKLCSVSLSNINVYACLVCGKYFQGRGPRSHAYFHALDVGHHVYINMQTHRVYVLPEGYEVKSRSLDDIKYVSDPTYSRSEVAAMDRKARTAWTIEGKQYHPGFVGLNNIKQNDYFNVVIQALAHVAPIRNYFMLESFGDGPELSKRMSLLVRKIWNPRAFKAHVSPHELLQDISLRSNKKYNLTTQADPAEFLSWFLNHLHLALGGSKTRPGSSIIQRVFQGRLKVESQSITARADASDRLRFEEAADVQTETTRYLVLPLDLPPTPLFQDELERNIIPQVALTTILARYDGRTSQEHRAHRRRHRLLHPLPPYLVFHVKRFSAHQFGAERNPTIVTFDARNLDMGPFTEPDPRAAPPGDPIWYDLVANVVHEAARGREDVVADGEATRKVWKCQVHNRATDEWLECQDLFVTPVPRELLYLGESYIQIWERRKTAGKSA